MRFSSLAPIFAALVLAGCSSTPSGSLTAGAGGGGSAAPAASASAATPTSSAGMGDSMCNADPIMNIVGKPINERGASDAQQRATAATLRLMRPGQVMTMEYNPRRLTIVVDEQNTVSSVRCG